jgi:SAM-dependent methyltransferase
MEIASYDPNICDFCGANESTTIIEKMNNRGLVSGSSIIRRGLKKVTCSRCGLVRDGLPIEGYNLAEYYSQDYQFNIKMVGEEHLFYTSEGPIPRSEVIHDWILKLKPQRAWNNINTALEVGCGQGNLLSGLSKTFPTILFNGVDLNKQAITIAKDKGLRVTMGSVEDAPSDKYDLIFAFGVLEHTPSPTSFLKALRGKLSKNGEVIIGQPVQDVENYDLFFVDHLHHFSSKHIKLLSKKVGFSEEKHIIGHPLIPSFSLHLLKIQEPDTINLHTLKLPIKTTCVTTIRKYQRIFKAIDLKLENISSNERLAVFGVSNIFALFYAYTNLANVKLVCGLDDFIGHQHYNPWPFPVVSPEKALELGITKVFLCVNPIYYSLIIPKIKKINKDIEVITFL